MRPRPPAIAVAFWVASGLGALAACGTSAQPRMEEPSRIPSAAAATPYRVAGVATRGPYLDATLEGPNSTMRFFFPADEDCTALIVSGADVGFTARPPVGVARSGEAQCTAVGIGSLREWRDRGPRQTRDIAPRGRAEFSRFYEDEELSLVRGRFPHVNLIRWVGGFDTVAAIPNTTPCRPIIERGFGTIEFRVAGPDPFRLVTSDGLCPIVALIQPIPGVPKR